MIRLAFLGTSAAAPTVSRNVSGLACRYAASGHAGRLMLFDCGEGSPAVFRNEKSPSSRRRRGSLSLAPARP